MKKVGIVSLGCAKNRVDSENILGLLDADKFELVDNVEEADLIVINTCGFIDASKKESIETIFEMLSYNKKVVVCGCLVERYYGEIKKEIPEIDLIIPIRDYPRFNELLSSLYDDIPNKGGLRDDLRVVSTGPFSAYLKIGEGCSNRCSYCAIPLIRGDFHSRPYPDIVDEAITLAAQGIKELVVLQQDTTKYGIDLPMQHKNIVDLLKALLMIPNLDYIRLLYLYPDEITDELIELIGKEERLTPYFDVPIQHSEDKILKAMYRRGDKEFLKSLFKKIRDKVPNAVLRTTVMVGFPGETDEDFQGLKDFVKEVGFDHLGAFSYSKEEGTDAYKLPDQVDEKTKQKRLDSIMRQQQSISYRRNKAHIGETMTGLVIGEENGYYLLRSYWNAPDDVDGKIFFKSDKKHELGDKVTVSIDNAFVYDLMGNEI